MPFRTLQEKDFAGRQEDLTRLHHRVLLADAGTAKSIVLSGVRGVGKTELLKQLFGRLFWKQDRVAPFYYVVNPALLSTAVFSRTYLTRFLCQRLAFEKKEQALFACENISLNGLHALADERNAGWARELISQYEQNCYDPLCALRFALSAPHRSALLSGTPVVVLIDEFQRLKHLSLNGVVEEQLISLFEEPLASSRAPHVITGNTSELHELPITGALERVPLTPIEFGDAAAQVHEILRSHDVEGTFPPLLLRRLGGNPWYLGCVANAVCSRKTPDDRDFWHAYVKEVTEGTLYHTWISVFKSFLPGLAQRKRALIMSHKICHTNEPLSCQQLALSLTLTDDQAEELARSLYLAGIIRGEFGVFRFVDDSVLRDIIDCLYAKEILAKPSHDLERECMEKLLPEKPGMVRFDLTLPMTKEAELVAAQCVEQVGKNLNLNQDVIGQLQIAVIEACINALEHSRGVEKKIFVSVVADENKLEVSIENAGQEFIVLETGEPFGNRDTAKTAGRGWGIKLMKRFVDDVRFEKTSRGVKTVLVKHLDSSLRAPQKEGTATHE